MNQLQKIKRKKIYLVGNKNISTYIYQYYQIFCFRINQIIAKIRA